MLTIVIILASLHGTPALAAGHGPVFGATTPTLGRGGWSIDQAWTARCGENGDREQMLTRPRRVWLVRAFANRSVYSPPEGSQA